MRDCESLSEIIEDVLRAVSGAQHKADVYARDLEKKYYQGGGLLEGMRAPKARIQSLTIEVGADLRLTVSVDGNGAVQSSLEESVPKAVTEEIDGRD